MKKIVFVFLLAVVSVTTYAQSFRLGLTAHPNFGFLKAENGKGDGLTVGFSYGLMGDFEFAENYCFATGLTVTSINGAAKILDFQPYHALLSSTGSREYNVKYKMQYIEVPLSLKLKTDELKGLKWYGQFGLSNDFAIRAKYDVSSNNTVLADDAKADKQTRFYRAGMIIGGGAEYKIDGKTSLTGGLTYNNGLTNIAKGDNGSVRNHYIALNIGVFF
ncbi:porin family protein [Pedobacter sp.]|uniref:porin family protein n=1 Tax=Pedobacter sp. TaxID=1411316 RepID=UPI00396CA242